MATSPPIGSLWVQQQRPISRHAIEKTHMITQTSTQQTTHKSRESLRAPVAKTAGFFTSAVQISGFLGALLSVLLGRLLF